MKTPPVSRPATPAVDYAIGALMAGLAAVTLLWIGACLAAVLTRSTLPALDGSAVARVLRQPDDPTGAWGTPMPGPTVYWTVTVAVAGFVTAAAVALRQAWSRTNVRAHRDPRRLEGLASSSEVRAAASRRAVLRRARNAWSPTGRVAATEVGYALGRHRVREVWASVEDSMLVVGPPRAGKGLHLVIPALLGAPGAVVTTSTRPDNLAVTMAARAERGPVAVFDPQRLAEGVPAGLRWSPIRGCELPQTAMIRARGLAAGTGMSRQVEGGDFWQGQTEAVLRALLHAAALDGRPVRDLYRS
jgi:type IV secretion system protein VirD4